MKITHVYIKDFIVFDEVDLELEDRVYFLSGLNYDEVQSAGSNGSGKSSFLQAIVWALFEDLRPGLLKDDVIRTYDRRGETQTCDYAQVIVTLVDDEGREIKVDRVRNHPDRKHDVDLIIDGEDVSQHKDADTNSKIEATLGISKGGFFQSCFSDDAKPPFASLSPAEMMKAVSDIIETAKFDRYNKLLTEEIKDKRLKTETVGNKFETAVGKVDFLTKQLETLEFNLEKFEQQRGAKVEQLRGDIAKTKALLKEKQENADSFAEKRKEFRDYDLSFQKEVSKLRKDREKLEQALLKAAFSVSEASGKRTKLNAQAKALEAEYDNLTNNTSGQCNYCGNFLEDSKTLEQKIDAVKAKLSKEGDAILLADAEILAAKAAEHKAQKALAKNRESAQEYEDQERAYHKLKADIEPYAVLSSEARSLSQKIVDLEKRLKDQEVSTSEGLTDSLKQTKAKLKEAYNLEDEAKAAFVEAEIEYQAVSHLKKAVAMVKSSRLNLLIDNLAGAINSQLEDLTGGDLQASLVAKNDSLILSFANSMKQRSFQTFSRGERARIAKAVQLALIESSGSFILIEDEGLSGIDPAGIPFIMEGLLNSKVNNLFFVTHDSKVQDWEDRFKTIVVNKKDGKSTVTVR